MWKSTSKEIFMKFMIKIFPERSKASKIIACSRKTAVVLRRAVVSSLNEFQNSSFSKIRNSTFILKMNGKGFDEVVMYSLSYRAGYRSFL